VDSSSLKASPVAWPRGFYGATKVDGVKRHVLVDSAGILVTTVVTPADVQDRTAFPKLPRKVKRVAPAITHVCVDNGYTGSTAANAAAKAGITVDVLSGPKLGRGFIVQPRRWVVARPNNWINHFHHIDRYYEARRLLTKVSSSSAKSPSYSDDSTAASCSTRFFLSALAARTPVADALAGATALSGQIVFDQGAATAARLPGAAIHP
jgi:transposase